MRMCEAIKRPPSRPGIKSRYCMPARPTYHASSVAFRRLITNSRSDELTEMSGIKFDELCYSIDRHFGYSGPTGQKNVRQKNGASYFSVSHFSVSHFPV